jgi:hypothetical protein
VLTGTLGAQICMNNRFMKPEDVLGCFVDEGVTFSAGVPTIWQVITT